MSMWILPLIGVVMLMLFIGIVSAREVHQASPAVTGKDYEIPKVIEDHPYALNPIFWIIAIATAFIGIVIIYYAALYY